MSDTNLAEPAGLFSQMHLQPCDAWLAWAMHALQIIRPYQLATVVVMAHPWVPDTGPLLDLVAQAEGEPSAEALTGQKRLRGTRGIGSWTLEWTGSFANALTTNRAPGTFPP